MSEASFFLEELRRQGIKVWMPNKQVGGNSELYRFQMDGRKYVLKVYKGDVERINRSRERELKSIEFLLRAGFSQVPKANLQLSPRDGACLEFIPGKNPKPSERTNKEILRAFGLLKEIYEEKPYFLDAVDACFTSSDVIHQIELRMQSIDSYYASQIRIALERIKLIEQIDFPKASMTFSFSDIGPHNMISRFRKFWFVDLEFFGRDSAVKMISDYLLHPKNVFTSDDIYRCIETSRSMFGISEEMLIKSVPFFATKWAAIVAKRLTKEVPDSIKLVINEKFNQYLELTTLSDLESISIRLIDLR